MPPQEKQDYLRLCNEYGVPFQDFHAQHCSHCFQPECTRSQAGKTKFDARTASWEESLFLKVPRMDPSDERFPMIAGQKFLAVLPNQAHTPSDWSDPRDLEAPKVISIPEPPPPVIVEAPPPVVATPVIEEPKIVTPQNPVISAPVLQNTPNKPRQMIGGAEPKPASPVLDPWQPMQPLKPGEQLVQPGARIKFGS